MFIELTTTSEERIMVNLNNTAIVWDCDDGRTYVRFTGEKSAFAVRETYDEIKLKMAGR